MARQRRFLACLTALAIVAVVLQGLTGMDQLALTLTPLFLLAALLLSGHFLGEDRIVARWRASAPPRSRRRAQRWRPRAVLPLRSVFEHGSFGVRGPPALLAPAA